MKKSDWGKFFSRIASPDAFKALCRRFPVALCMVTALTLLLLLSVGDYKLWNDRWYGTAVFYCSSGAILALALHLWAEEETTARLRRGVQVAAHVLWAANAIYLYAVSDVTPELCVGNAALVAAMTAAVFAGSFLRDRSDLSLWLFALHTVAAAAVAWLTGLALWGGIALLLTTLERLLGWDAGPHALEYVGVVCNVLLAAVLFLSQVPEGDEKHVEHYRPVRILTVLARYVLLPLLGAYLAVLYAYTLRIVGRWELPEGWVAWPVTALMAGMLLWFVTLYPVRVGEGRKWDVRLARWLPVAVLPLLLLMTAGVWCRLSTYGITAMRLYLLAFNLWCYGICAYLTLSRAKRIRWILLSFSGIFVLTSVGPQSFMAVTRRVLTAQVKQVWAETPRAPKLPMDNAAYENWLRQLGDTAALRVDGKLDYLRYTYGIEAIEDVVSKPVRTGNYRPAGAKSDSYGWRAASNPLPVPQGFRYLYEVSESTQIKEEVLRRDTLEQAVTLKLNGRERTVHVVLPLSRLRKLSNDNEQNGMKTMPCREKDVCFYLTGFHIYYSFGDTRTSTENKYGYGSIDGYLFLR